MKTALLFAVLACSACVAEPVQPYYASAAPAYGYGYPTYAYDPGYWGGPWVTGSIYFTDRDGGRGFHHDHDFGAHRMGGGR